MKKIYFVRHAESTGNAGDVFSSKDIDITDQGIKQANLIAERFKSIPIDTLVSSDSKRAIQTAEVINKFLKIELHTSPLFSEIKRPAEIEGVARGKVAHIVESLDQKFADPDWHHSDEENFHDFKKRALQAVDFLEQQTKEHILVVTHSKFLRMFIAVLMFGKDLTPHEYIQIRDTFKTENTGITVCTISENLKWRIVIWNDHAHLGEISPGAYRS